MPSVFRSTVLLGALALGVTSGLTACGDKITQTTTSKDSSVQSVLVSPPGPVPLKVGDKVTFAASVTGGPDLTNKAVTWKSSAPTVASVDNTGLVTALAGGTASIIATSVANTGVSGAAVVTVAATVNATVTIGQINQTVCGPSCASVPATLSNVANQLDVTLNVDPGTQTISEVDLIMNCTGAGNSGQDTVVDKQTVNASDVAPLSVEAATSPVTLSFNTAAFNPTTGVVALQERPVHAQGEGDYGAGSQNANNPQTLTLNNLNVIVATFATTPGTGQIASATDANGLLWRAGSVTVTAIPIIYTSANVATGSISLINSGSDDALGKNGVVVARQQRGRHDHRHHADLRCHDGVIPAFDHGHRWRGRCGRRYAGRAGHARWTTQETPVRRSTGRRRTSFASTTARRTSPPRRRSSSPARRTPRTVGSVRPSSSALRLVR